MTDAKDLTPERRILLCLRTRIIALENADLILGIALGCARKNHPQWCPESDNKCCP